MSDSTQNDDDDSDASESYTPQPTRTKSGRSVNKPVAFVPVIPEPTPGVKRRKSTKTMLAAKCKTCRRDTDPSQNRIVFCDSCSTAYHQYCHNPPISNEVVTVLEKEWLCGPCARAKESVVQGTEHLVAAESLSIDEVSLTTSVLRYPTNMCTETRVPLHSHTTPARLSPSPRYNTTSRTSYLPSKRH